MTKTSEGVSSSPEEQFRARESSTAALERTGSGRWSRMKTDHSHFPWRSSWLAKLVRSCEVAVMCR